LTYGEHPRGITFGDVSHAADTLFRAGQRPTVQKIRATIGRGSPNTIGPLLDQWWSTAAARLDSGPAALHRLPEPVAHVAESLWLQALDEGRRQAKAELNSTVEATEEQAQRLKLRAHVLSLREGELDQRLRERERALADTQTHLLSTLKRLDSDRATLRARDARIAHLQSEIEDYRRQFATVVARAVAKHRAPTVKRSRREVEGAMVLPRSVLNAGSRISTCTLLRTYAVPGCMPGACRVIATAHVSIRSAIGLDTSTATRLIARRTLFQPRRSKQ